MQGSNGQSSPARNPGKPERPPKTKRSKISDDSQTRHFPGPLFPAVRRLSPTPPISSNFSTTTSSSSTASSPGGGGGSSDACSFQFSDRDYVFPFNLGPYSTRRNVSVKSSSSSSSFSKSQHQKQHPPPQLPGRCTSMSPRLSSAGKGGVSKVDSECGIGFPVDKPKPRVEKDLKALSLQASVSASSGLLPSPSRASTPRDSANSSNVQENSSFRNSLKANLLTFFCCISVSYAIILRIAVSRLQEENTYLHRFCSHENVVDSNSIEVLELKHGSSFLLLGNTDPKAIALYTVIVTLITPFVLYKCLDYLPRIKNFSKRIKDCREEVPLKKRIAYMVDVCFSIYPYAKLFALLLATLFLIGFGGLALYAVGDGSFTFGSCGPLWRTQQIMPVWLVLGEELFQFL